MTTAQQILVVFGMIIGAYGLLLGIPMAGERRTKRHANQHLVEAHNATLMMAGMYMALGWAAGHSDLADGWNTAGAILAVLGAGLIAAGGSMNWLAGTDDQFAERSGGYLLNAAGGPPSIIGWLILTVGVIAGI